MPKTICFIFLSRKIKGNFFTTPVFVFCALFADLLIAAEAESLHHHAGVDTTPCFIFGVGGAMKGLAHRNNGYSKSGNDVRGVADWAEELAKGLQCSGMEETNSRGLDTFLLLKHTQHILYLKMN